MSMWLIAHPGWCCGINTIYGFSFQPTSNVGELTAKSIAAFKTAYPTCVWPLLPVPNETALKRFRRFIQLRESVRPLGIIEVVLTLMQLSDWKEVLAEHHFKESCRNVNSNTNNTIVVFHRLSGAPGVDVIKEI